jgi:penicillin V acylase-like amidase (Ntn superfamily)
MRRIGLVFVMVTLMLTNTTQACSSFSLERDNVLIVGRNLDANQHIHGLVVINKRGVQKTGRSLQWLISGQCDSPAFSWVSKYGSLTFNATGIDFPESGVNEKGLVVEEMSLMETEYPDGHQKPILFMELWIQFMLDTCATVDEVIASLETVSIDGWGWHFYVADKTGNSAAISYLDGKARVYNGESLPQRILCNSIYDEELAELENFVGFGGEQAVDLNNPKVSRFAQAAHLLKEFGNVDNPTTYGFGILDTMSRNTTKWAKIIDLKNMRATFRTNTNLQLRSIDLTALDYTCGTPRLILDIHTDLSGDVTHSFIESTNELHSTLVGHSIADLAEFSEFDALLESMGGSRKGMTKRFNEYPDTADCD